MSVRRRFASPSTEKPRFLCLFQRKSPHNFCTKILHRTSCDRVGRSGCRLPQISPISTDKLHSACEESVFICRADDWQAPRWHLCSSVRSVGEKSTAWPIPPIPHLTLHVIDHPLPAKECRSAAPMARSVLLVSSPHGICVPQCDLWAYKTPAWPHSIIPHPTDHSTFHIPRSTFHVPHSTFHVPHSTFNIPRSTFNIPRSTFNIPHTTFHIPHYKLFLSARVRAAVKVRHLLRWLLSRQPPPSVVFADPKGAHPRSPKCRRAKVFPLLISLFCNGNVKY